MVNVYKNDEEKVIVDLLEELLIDLGFKVVKIRITKKKELKNCTMAIERIDLNPVSLFDCRQVYHFLQDLINNKTLPLTDYLLEVGSPGINKPLTRIEDFKSAVNMNIKVYPINKVEEKKVLQGKLEHVDSNMFTLKTTSDNKKYCISFDEISEAYLNKY